MAGDEHGTHRIEVEPLIVRTFEHTIVKIEAIDVTNRFWFTHKFHANLVFDPSWGAASQEVRNVIV